MYGIFRTAKLKASALHFMEAEHNRDKEHIREFVNSPNIHWERTELNFHPRNMRVDGWLDYVKKQIEAKGIKRVRKDATLCLDSFYSASSEFWQNADDVTRSNYIKACIAFNNRHCGETFNVVVHQDETTIHCHMTSIPFSLKPDGTWTLSAKALLGGKKEMSRLQDAFYEEVSKQFGLERGEKKTSEHQRVHLSTLEYQKQERQKEKMQLEDDIDEIKKAKAEILDTVDDPVSEIYKLRRQVEELEDELNYSEKLFERLRSAIEYVADSLGIYNLVQMVTERFNKSTFEREEPAEMPILSPDDFEMEL